MRTPDLSALTIAALITPTGKGDTKGERRHRKGTKTNRRKKASQPMMDIHAFFLMRKTKS